MNLGFTGAQTPPQQQVMNRKADTLPDWANLKVIHRNTLPPRAYFHQYDGANDALSADVSKARVHSLNGTWKFHLTKSPLESPTGCERDDFSVSNWQDIKVPGMWQLQGFGRGPQYTNIQYPFNCDPPFPPFTDNECGTYVTFFGIPQRFQHDQLRLRFEGVDSAFHVWINGFEVGYSQGSRNSSEFDISKHVRRYGQNKLVVRVYQFCDGSYIEDQDQWWLSGIFRDVTLLGFPHQAHFEDFTIQTSFDKKYKNADLAVHVETTGTGVIDVKLLDSDQKEIATAAKEVRNCGRHTTKFNLSIEKPHKWTAETPYLYHLLISLDEQLFVAHRVGFRCIEVKDGLIKINGERVVFKGANRHEHHPQHGRAVPLEFLRHDLELMKKHNINAIRTCHQPNDPRLYDLADAMGFWIIDEADLECHGFGFVGDAEKWTSDNPDWHDAYLDRAKQLVHRDKLHPSVVIWSLGNEAFYGRNHSAMSDWIRSHDRTRLIHYEPDGDASHTDMYSRMYFSVNDMIREFSSSDVKRKPMVLCEYIHAMGTGPGNIKSYVEAFYKHPKLQGGWVWEWANHGLRTYTKNGTPYYGYGGDFGDIPNDYNFVMDGVCQSDHTPNSGLIEYKKAIEPVQVIRSDGKTAKIVNRLDFATLDHLECFWTLVGESGYTSQSGRIHLPKHIQPTSVVDLELPDVKIDFDGEALMELTFRLKESTSWAEKGYELAWGQVQLKPIAQITTAMCTDLPILRVEEAEPSIKVIAANNVWAIDRTHGSLSSWIKNGQEIIAEPLQPSFYRALTDNDAGADGREWKDRNLHLARNQTRKIEWQLDSNGGVVVKVYQKHAPPVFAWALELVTTYVFEPSGCVRIHIKGKPVGRDPPATLARLGVTLGLHKSMQTVDWFGRGSGESYKDMKESQRVGRYAVSSVDQLWKAAPEFPQDCGNRTDTRWVRLGSDKVRLEVQFFDPMNPEDRHLFDFMACQYDVQDIDEAKHPHELATRKKDVVVLRLDADHHGLGTASCGPKTAEEHALKTEEFEFGLLLQ